MLQKRLLYLLGGILSFVLIGCSCGKQPEAPATNGTFSASQETNKPFGKQEENLMGNCRLFVNGKDISDQHYAKINHEENNAELPVLGVLVELGAEIKWQDVNVVEITHKGKTVCIDTQETEFGIPLPPGASGSVRQVINDELIIDYVSIKGLLQNMMDATVQIDYDASVIYINSTTQ